MKILMNSHIFPSEIPILSPFEDILSPEIFIWQVFIQPTWLIAPPDSWAPVLVRPAAGEPAKHHEESKGPPLVRKSLDFFLFVAVLYYP